jgi:poly(hydroxyalkanoate) depolymerase family esterase
MAYINWKRAGAICAGALTATLTAMSVVGVAGAQPTAGTLTTQSYTNAAGTRSYELYVPASYHAGANVPLIVALHGCTQTADKFRQQTHFDDLADTKGFIVAYPEQPQSANYLNCWNFFQQQHMQRGSGEPSLIAGITGQIQQRYSVDVHRTYVSGLSAGGAMAEVMAATYPDVYAAAGVGSGCEYGGTAACAGYQSTDPEQAGKLAYQAMGSHARQMPFIVVQGDADKTVPPINAQQLVREDQVEADWSDDGQENGSVPQAPTKVDQVQAPGGKSYTVSHYSDGHGHELGQFWLVHGMAHAWSGGDASQQYSDPAGPNESQAMYDFFMGHTAP